MERKRNRQVMKLALFGLLAALLLALAACGSANHTNDADGNSAASNAAVNGAHSNSGNSPAENAANDAAADNSSADAATDPAAETVYPLTVTDVTGTEVVIDKAPEKIVSIVPSETEVLYAVGAGPKVAGVDTYSNYPPEAADVAKVGDFKTDIEAVAALAPDLVVASSAMNGEAIEALRKLNIKVYASNPRTLDETIAHIEQVGAITNNNAKAKEVADGMRAVKQQVADTVKDAPKKRVYLEFNPGWTVGSGEFLDELVTLAGGTNIGGTQPGWYEIDAEAILKANPEVIIYPEYGEDKTIPDAINSRPGWNGIDAVKNKQVYAVTNDPLVRVGPRLTDGLLEVAKAIHPDLFK